MKKYLFFILLLACPSLLHADTVYFKDGTCVEGKITSENDKLVIIKESKAQADKTCEYPRSNITKIEKKALKPTCNFTHRVSEKKEKPRVDKPAKEIKPKESKPAVAPEPIGRFGVPPAAAKTDKVSPAQAKPKGTKGTEQVKQVKETKDIKKAEEKKKPEKKKKTAAVEKKETGKKKKAEPAKTIKPVKETPAKPKPQKAKTKADKASLAKKNKAQDEAFKKLESKSAQPVFKKPAKPISVKPLKSAQEAELRKIEKAKSEKNARAAKEARVKIDQAQDKAFKKLEKKIAAAAPKPAPAPKQPETAQEGVPEKKKIIQYRVAKREDKNLPEPSKMNRVEVSIIVSPDASKEEIEAALAELLEKELASRKKIDALWAIIYVEGEYPTRLPKAYSIWSPPGGWYDWKNISDKSQYKWNYRSLKNETLAPRW